MRKKNKKSEVMIKRVVRLKKRRKKILLSSIVFLSFAILLTTLAYSIYINYKSKNLSYNVNYSLINNIYIK